MVKKLLETLHYYAPYIDFVKAGLLRTLIAFFIGIAIWPIRIALYLTIWIYEQFHFKISASVLAGLEYIERKDPVAKLQRWIMGRENK